MCLTWYLKEKFIVEDDSEDADVSGGGQSGGVNSESEVVSSFVRDLGPMMSMSDLSQLSWRKFVFIHDFISLRQFVRV